MASLKRSRLGVLILGTLLVTSAAVVVLWLLEASGRAQPDLISQLMAAAWVLLLAAFTLDWVVRCWRCVNGSADDPIATPTLADAELSSSTPEL